MLFTCDFSSPPVLATFALTLTSLALAAPKPSISDIISTISNGNWECVNMATDNFATMGWDFPFLPSIPAGHRIWIQTSGALDLQDDDSLDFNNKFKRRSVISDVSNEVKRISKPSLTKSKRGELEVGARSLADPTSGEDLAIRAATRPYENPNYRVIAAQSGIVMIHTVAGELGDAARMQEALPARAWAGDHIFELNMFTQFLNYIGNTQLIKLIKECDDYNIRITNILNSVTNLLGVDSVINNLKMALLQKGGPTDWTRYPVGTYLATGKYFTLVQDHYFYVVGQLRDMFNDIHNHDTFISADIGQQFYDWATQKFLQAGIKIAQHTAANQNGFGPGFETIAGPS